MLKSSESPIRKFKMCFGRQLAFVLLAALLCVPVLAASEATQSSKITVWVNAKSGVYHCPGTAWYGKTKIGVFLEESAAQDKGYRPAYGKACRALAPASTSENDPVQSVAAPQCGFERWPVKILTDTCIAFDIFTNASLIYATVAHLLRNALELAGASLIAEKAPLPYHIFFNVLPSDHLRFFQSLELFHRTADVICVHAGTDLDCMLAPENPDVFVWGTSLVASQTNTGAKIASYTATGTMPRWTSTDGLTLVCEPTRPTA